VLGIEWGVLVAPIQVDDGEVVGALVVARHGRTWSSRERSLTKAFGGLLSNLATRAGREGALLVERRLDELVAKVADRLMSATARNRQEVMDWTAETLAHYLEADVCFIRRNDLVRGLSVLDAEWPIRYDKPDPDPLGEVAFDADPIFMEMRDLKTPYLTGVADLNDTYIDRAVEAAGVSPAAGAAVPLLMGETTWGIIGFLHLNLHAWLGAEINALQAVASLLVQMQARIDAEEKTRYNANHDELTGLPNRRAFLEELKSRLQAKRPTAVMLIDLDRFKFMNDFLGHGSGDRLLMTIADRIRTSIRTNDFAARLAGDEFIFIADNVSEPFELLGTAQRILDLIARPVSIAGQEVSHTASIGIAVADDKVSDPLELLGWADVAMYAAKDRGRNQFVIVDDELRASEHERSDTEFRLREAIERQGLRLYYQPEVDLRTGKLLAVEALLRWNHPEKGIVAAADFIKIAEETGLVTDIGRFVFVEACRQLAEWRKEYPELEFVVRVNMSPADLRVKGLVDFVRDCLLRYEVPGRRLCVEITEYAMVDDPESTIKALKAFQDLGVEIALDDFGTGTGTYTELKTFPVDLLKIDRSFVMGVVTDRFDQVIVKNVVDLGEALDMGVIAEGIEDTDVVQKLLDLGCCRGQGYLISRPVPPADLVSVLRTGSVPLSLLRPSEAARPAPSLTR
jgi:diguanylate cyclase (GGDEF)-like protein